jgi:hypothetical protein
MCGTVGIMTDQPKKRGGKRKGSGRKNGSVSKSTLRKIAITAAESQAKEHVAAAIEEARAQGLMEGKDHRGRKRAVTVLEEFMLFYAGMAESVKGKNEKRFDHYAKLAIDTAGMLANYQSPKFKAVMVAAAPPQEALNAPKPGDNAKVVGRIGNPALVYKRMIQGVE